MKIDNFRQRVGNKKQLLALIFCSVLPVFGKASTGIEFQAGFFPETNEIMVAEPIYVAFYITNSGSQTFYLETGGDYRGIRSSSFHFKAQSADGHAAPDPNPKASNMGGMVQTLAISPGHSYKQQLYLPLWITFDEPGKYTISAEHLVRLKTNAEFSRDYALTNSVRTDFQITVLPKDAARLGNRIRQLGERLDSPEVSQATRQLADIDDERVVPYLLRVIEENKRDVIAEAVTGLGKHPDAQVCRVLIRAMHDPSDDWIRSRAANALGNMKFGEAQDALIDALDTGDHGVTYEAANALRNFRGERTIKALESHLSEPSMDVRLAYVETLAALGVPFNAEWIIPIIRSQKLNEFQNAIWFVRRNSGSNAPMILAACLDHENASATNYYNYTLAWQIGACGGPKLTYKHDFYREGTPEQIDENKKTLATFSAWLNSSTSAAKR
jgi:hypothetical protein